jgi:hypothetical protein
VSLGAVAEMTFRAAERHISSAKATVVLDYSQAKSTIERRVRSRVTFMTHGRRDLIEMDIDMDVNSDHPHRVADAVGRN